MGKRKREIDMLSGLPDEILHHILSFLPTKFSVRTSALAKRWRFVWTHVPSLQFSGRSFKGSTAKPLDIISRVLMLHKAKTVNTFSFRPAKVRDCAYQLETMFIYLIQHSVRNLYLDFNYSDRHDVVCTFPRLLLTCKTLVDLELVSCGVIPSSGELFLPSLKKLHLSFVEYESDESLPHFLSGCPVLEELLVRDCVREGQKNSGRVVVSSPTVKSLIVDFSYVDDNPEEMLIIDVPALVYLNVICCELECMKSLRKTMNSLIEAKLHLHGDWHSCGIDCTEHGRSIEFLSCLCNVKYLKITSHGFSLVDIIGTSSMPKFVHLTNLKLLLTVNWYNLVKIVEVADNLEVLIIDTIDMTPYQEPKRVPACMLSRLRTVRMHRFNACEDAFDVVRYILRNAQVLERMEISCDSCLASGKEKFDALKVKFDALQRISLFERVSKSCQVAFNTDEIYESRGQIYEESRRERLDRLN